MVKNSSAAATCARVSSLRVPECWMNYFILFLFSSSKGRGETISSHGLWLPKDDSGPSILVEPTSDSYSASSPVSEAMFSFSLTIVHFPAWISPGSHESFASWHSCVVTLIVVEFVGMWSWFVMLLYIHNSSGCNYYKCHVLLFWTKGQWYNSSLVG